MWRTTRRSARGAARAARPDPAHRALRRRRRPGLRGPAIRGPRIGVHCAPVLDGRRPGRSRRLAAWLAHPVVTVREVLTRSTVWDRGSDPMTRITASGHYDNYGRPHASMELGVPRGRDPREPGAPCLATVTFTSYATRDDAAMYRIDRTASTARHEAIDPGTAAVTDFARERPRRRRQRRTPGHAVQLLRRRRVHRPRPRTARRPRPARPHRTPRHHPATSSRKPCSPRPPAPPLGPCRPTSTRRERLPPARTGRATPRPFSRPSLVPACLTHAAANWATPGTPTAPYAAGYYAQTQPTGLRRPDSDLWPGPPRSASWSHATPTAATPPPNGTASTLLPARVTDPARLTTSAVYDYRIFKPAQVTDANGNSTSIGYTPLGLPA